MQRDSYFDFWRGIAIIMVIGIHTYSDGFMHMNLVLRQFLNCAVPIFLAISGYFIGKKSFSEKGSYGAFLKKQVPRVYVPMLVWSIPWMVLAIHGGQQTLIALLRTFVGDMSIFYFIILIIQYYALTPVIQKANMTIRGGQISVVITIIGISCFDYVLRMKGVELSLVESAGLFPVWMLFFVMGVLKAQNINFPIRIRHYALGVMVSIGLCLGQIYWFQNLYGNVVPGIKLSSHVYTYIIIAWMFSGSARNMYNKLCGTKIIQLMNEIGRLSVFIWLCHTLMLWVFSHLPIPSFWYLRWILCAIVSYLLAKGSKHICPREIRRYIGF